MSNTVIVLGAGASIAEGAPSQAALLRDYFEWRKSGGGRPNLKAMDDGLADFFKSIWGVDVKRGNLATTAFPTFEESLGILELAHTRSEFLRGFGGIDPAHTRALTLRQWLIASIALVLQHKLEHSNRLHDRLLSNLRRSGWWPDTSFISLNYDIAIDNAVLRGGLRADYGFDSHMHHGAPNPVQLLKIHGSLNWMYCPTCGEIDVRPGEKIAAQAIYDFHKAKCGRCREHRVAIIIPPSFFKVFNNPYLQQVWMGAERALRSADRIIFCGYSFPDADLHFKYLLKRAEVNRTGRAPAVLIVNQHRGKTKHDRDLEQQRYTRFFRDKANVRWTGSSFEQFADDPKGACSVK